MLEEFIENFKKNPKKDLDETSTKQALILPILQKLGWDIFNIDEVKPEHSVENRRVDFSLRIKGADEVFLEAKNTSESLENHEEQLLDYAFRQGVDLAILTNGITWSFYLPTQKGDWKARKFYTIDILQQETQDIVIKFTDLLSKENISSGKALQVAEEIYKGRQKRIKIEETLPESWRKIISEPDEILIDLLAETTEKLCGYKPEHESIKEFLSSQKGNIIQAEISHKDSKDTNISKTERGYKTNKPIMPKVKKAKKITLKELAEEGLIRDGQILFFFHTRLFKEEQAKIVLSSNSLRYLQDNKIYAISELAKILLKKRGLKDNDYDVAGPWYWKTYDGKLLNDLNEIIRQKRGDRR
jgi:predicted type IV restriction endonuclease